MKMIQQLRFLPADCLPVKWAELHRVRLRRLLARTCNAVRDCATPSTHSGNKKPSQRLGFESLNRIFNNGEGGIRTHGCFHIAGFQDQSHQPLDHLSLWDNSAVILVNSRAVLLGLHDFLERCKMECFSSIQWYYALSFHTTNNIDFKTLC